MFEKAMFELSSQLLLLLVDASAKSVVILVLAILAMQAIRFWNKRQSDVHVTHRIWMFVTISILILPLLTLCIPRVSIPVSGLAKLVPKTPIPDVAADFTTESPRSSPLPERSSKEKFSASIEVAGNPESGTEDQATIAPHSPRRTLQQESFVAEDSSRESLAVNLPPVPAQISTIRSAERNIFPGVMCLIAGFWVVVTSILFVRFGIAVRHARNLVAKSCEISPPVELQEFLPRKTRLFTSGDIDSPVVIGWFSFAIPLPGSWQGWSEEKTRAVLAHESAHIRRRDGIVSLVAEFSTVFYWFNPIVWLSKKQLSRLAELACDQPLPVTKSDQGYFEFELPLANGFDARMQLLAMSSDGNRTRCRSSNRKPSRYRSGTRNTLHQASHRP